MRKSYNFEKIIIIFRYCWDIGWIRIRIQGSSGSGLRFLAGSGTGFNEYGSKTPPVSTFLFLSASSHSKHIKRGTVINEKCIQNHWSKRFSFEPDLNQRPKDSCYWHHYSPPLYQLSYRRELLKLPFIFCSIWTRAGNDWPFERHSVWFIPVQERKRPVYIVTLQWRPSFKIK